MSERGRVHKYVTERAQSSNAAKRKKDQQEGAIAQLGEHLLCKQGVGGSIPPGSTIFKKLVIEPAFRSLTIWICFNV
jgi:hypothetical protein